MDREEALGLLFGVLTDKAMELAPGADEDEIAEWADKIISTLDAEGFFSPYEDE